MDFNIKTYSTLYDLIEMDSENNPIKEIGKLFLTAMNDWPTKTEVIEDFKTELKEYFGNPLIPKIIDKKRINIDCQNIWRHESGSSISELIKLSEVEFNETDFDKILKRILNKYEMEYRKLD